MKLKILEIENEENAFTASQIHEGSIVKYREPRMLQFSRAIEKGRCRATKHDCTGRRCSILKRLILATGSSTCSTPGQSKKERQTTYTPQPISMSISFYLNLASHQRIDKT